MSAGRMAAIAVMAMAAPAGAEPQSSGITVTYEAESGVATTYVFRGIPQYSTPRIPSSETSLTAAFEGLGPGEGYVNVFSALALQDRDEQENAETEIDLELGYGLGVSERFEVGGGYRVFLLPSDDPVDAAHELGAYVSMLELPITPTVEAWVDPLREQGVYASAGATKELEVAGVRMEPKLSAGVQKYSGVPGGFNDVTLQLSARWALPHGVYVAGLAAYAYAHVLDGDYVDRSIYWYYAGVGYER